MYKDQRSSQENLKIQGKSMNSYFENTKIIEPNVSSNDADGNVGPFRGYRITNPSITTNDSKSRNNGVSRGIFSTNGGGMPLKKEFLETQNSMVYKSTLPIHDQATDRNFNINMSSSGAFGNVNIQANNIQELIANEVKLQLSQIRGDIAQYINQSSNMEETLKQHTLTFVDISQKIEHLQTDLCHLSDSSQIEIETLKQEIKNVVMNTAAIVEKNLKNNNKGYLTSSQRDDQLDSNCRMYTDNKFKILEIQNNELGIQMNETKDLLNKNVNIVLNDIAKKISDDNSLKLKDLTQEMLNSWEKKLSTVIGYIHDRLSSVEKFTHSQQRQGDSSLNNAINLNVVNENVNQMINEKMKEVNKQLQEHATNIKKLIEGKADDSNIKAYLAQQNKDLENKINSLRNEANSYSKGFNDFKNDLTVLQTNMNHKFHEIEGLLMKTNNDLGKLVNEEKLTRIEKENMIGQEQYKFDMIEKSMQALANNQINLQKSWMDIHNDLQMLKLNIYNQNPAKNFVEIHQNSKLYHSNQENVKSIPNGAHIYPEMNYELDKMTSGPANTIKYQTNVQHNRISSEEAYYQQDGSNHSTERVVDNHASSNGYRFENIPNSSFAMTHASSINPSIMEQTVIRNQHDDPTLLFETTRGDNDGKIQGNSNASILSNNNNYSTLHFYNSHQNSIGNNQSAHNKGDDEYTEEYKMNGSNLIESQTLVVNREYYPNINQQLSYGLDRNNNNINSNRYAISIDNLQEEPAINKQGENELISENVANKSNPKDHMTSMVKNREFKSPLATEGQASKDSEPEEQELSLVYQLDEYGFLMDEDGNYVLDDNGKKLKLTEEQMESLKVTSILEEQQI